MIVTRYATAMEREGGVVTRFSGRREFSSGRREFSVDRVRAPDTRAAKGGWCRNASANGGTRGDLLTEDRAHLLAVDDFLLEESVRDLVEYGAPLAEDAVDASMAALEDLLYFGVDGAGLLLAVLLGRDRGAFEETRAPFALKGSQPECLAHAVLSHHAERYVGGALQVILSPGGDVTEGQLLGH